jgi:hypothetical protein
VSVIHHPALVAPALRWGFAFSVIALVLSGPLACGEMPDDLLRIDEQEDVDDRPPPAHVMCEAAGIKLEPAFDSGPHAATTALSVQWSGVADDVVFDVVGPLGQPIAGTTWVDDEAAFFVPHQPYPAGRISWAVALCGDLLQTHFEAGEVVRPLNDAELDGLVGVPFSFDMRVADWAQPDAINPDDAALMRARYGGAFWVRLYSLKADDRVAVITPAIADLTGLYVADTCRSEHVIEVHDDGNPYLGIAVDELGLAVSGGEITLHDLEMVFGLSPEGPRDGRLQAQMDVRNARPGDAAMNGCEELAAMAWEHCARCPGDSADTEGCVALKLEGLSGLPLLHEEAMTAA